MGKHLVLPKVDTHDTFAIIDICHKLKLVRTLIKIIRLETGKSYLLIVVSHFFMTNLSKAQLYQVEESSNIDQNRSSI